ncbi:hypothetical protein [Hoeflea sp.]|uniref:hypothetical protein n=1 Tax=Hoeflea sp. TaxID=1940281 RepID=UPI003747C424
MTAFVAAKKWAVIIHLLEDESSDLISRLLYEQSIVGTNIDYYGTIDVLIVEVILFVTTLIPFILLAMSISRKYGLGLLSRTAVYGLSFAACSTIWRIFAPSLADFDFLEGMG